MAKLYRIDDESGQALVLVTLCLPCLVGFLGIGVDLGTLFLAKQRLQTAADSAAVAGAAEIPYTDLSVNAAALAAAASNGITNGVNGASVAVNWGPTIGQHAGDTKYVEVIVSQPQFTPFIGVLRSGHMSVTARAVGTNTGGSTCLYALAKSGTNVELKGQGSLSASTCGMLFESTSSGSIDVKGNGSLNASKTGSLAGASAVQSHGNGSVTPTPISVVASGDPLAGLPQPTVPGSGCTSMSTSGKSSVLVYPGCYTNLSFGGSGPVTLSPGLYVMNGPLNLGGSGAITGDGVTIYLSAAAGQTDINGNGAISLTAPTSGTYNGILFFQQRGDSQQFSISSSSTVLNGVLYAPDAIFAMKAKTDVTCSLALVVSEIDIKGQGSLNLLNYSQMNAASPLTRSHVAE